MQVPFRIINHHGDRSSFIGRHHTIIPRGGATRPQPAEKPESKDDSDDQEQQQEEEEQQQDAETTVRLLEKQDRLQKYKWQQQQLLQLRSTILSEALAQRGVSIATIADVSTPEGAKPPVRIDWDCALSTREDKKVRKMHASCALSAAIRSLIPTYTLTHTLLTSCL
jgi:hypothetical protein